MDRKEYLQNYKKYHYSKTRKIVTFPLMMDEFEKLEEKALSVGITTNTKAKQVIIGFLENSSPVYMSQEQKKILAEYMRISRGIANNINQLSHSANMGEYIDINILIVSLKSYEDAFKDLLSNLEQ